MTTEDRAPGLIRDGTSVNWKVEIDASTCTFATYEWCEYLNEKCGYGVCPCRVNGSFTEKEE